MFWHNGEWQPRAVVMETAKRAHVTFRAADEVKVLATFKEALPVAYRDTLQITEDATGAMFWHSEKALGTLSYLGANRIGIQWTRHAEGVLPIAIVEDTLRKRCAEDGEDGDVNGAAKKKDDAQEPLRVDRDAFEWGRPPTDAERAMPAEAAKAQFTEAACFKKGQLNAEKTYKV